MNLLNKKRSVIIFDRKIPDAYLRSLHQEDMQEWIEIDGYLRKVLLKIIDHLLIGGIFFSVVLMGFFILEYSKPAILALSVTGGMLLVFSILYFSFIKKRMIVQVDKNLKERH